MRISEFYHGYCPKKVQIDSLVKKDDRPIFYHRLVMQVCRMMRDGRSKEQVLHTCEEVLSGQPDSQYDVFCVRRFLDWLGECEILESCKKISLPIGIDLPDGSRTLEETAGLVVCFPNGTYGAILPFFKKTDKSVYGKSVHTATGTDLYAMTAKAALEPQYPGIVVTLVYLRSDTELPERPAERLVCGNTKKSNVFSQDFSAYISDGVFDMDFFMDAIRNIAAQPVEKKCADCSQYGLCHMEKKVARSAQKPESGYVMPQFTARQKEVIHHVDGPMLVCAGPGSGKTATLVGRVQYLIDTGIPPEVILVITFTNEAADELRSRCQSFCEPEGLPKISTINALGYEILKENDTGAVLMTQADQLQLVKSLLDVSPRISGITYGKTGGKYGLYRTVLGKIERYLSCETKEEFFLKEASLDTDFVSLAEQYRDIVQARGFITFDEQVTLCNRLFSENPAVLAVYQHLFRYVMVDEYQDINADQNMFITAIAAHGNIVAVGDDDQSVYGFRGASNRYMLDFKKQYADAVTVVLDENFRSVQSLVNASQELIRNNSDRIQKDIRSKRAGNAKPVLVDSCLPDAFDRCVSECVSMGYSLKDIAILSTKNAPLEQLHDTMRTPTVLAKSYLREDPLFLAVYDILSLHKDIMDETALFQYLSVMNVDTGQIHRESGQTLYDAVRQGIYPDVHDYRAYDTEHPENGIYSALRLLSSMFYVIEEDPDASFLLGNIAYYLGWEDASSLPVIQDMIRKEHIETADELLQKMSILVEFEDDTRIDIRDEAAVLLITAHESKGREFPVVLMLDNYSEATAETRRLFYVAMTRAKDRLYIFKENGSSFLSELPDLERRHYA